jgi:hypothetical protein
MSVVIDPLALGKAARSKPLELIKKLKAEWEALGSEYWVCDVYGDV